MPPQDAESSSIPDRDRDPQHATEDDRGTLKRKRSKYASRACHYCQRRKIKCDGADPCGPCSHRGQSCQRPNWETDEFKQRRSSGNSASDSMINFLLRRLVQLEERVERSDNTNADEQPDKSSGYAPQQLHSPQASSPSATSLSRDARQSQGVIWDDGSPFAGEITLRYSLEVMEERLDRLGVHRLDRPSSPPAQSLTPAICPSTPTKTSPASQEHWRRTGNMRQLLDSYGLVFQLGDWKAQLESYFAEVHPLYPFLIPAQLWDTFHHLWASYSSSTPMPLGSNQDLELRLAIVFLCLATGKCTTGNRKQNEARHSAGWTFYCVANELIGDPLHLCVSSRSSMLQLQTLCSMVVYLFRLDANERAQNVLALAVSHAHTLGINRISTTEKMTLFEDESFRRIWWCIYVLDRRLCLETGRPFLILDMNIDAALPSDVDEDWLWMHKDSTVPAADLDPLGSTKLSNHRSSSIAYLKAMIGYSRISGKVWESFYAAPVAKQPLNELHREYVELSLDQWRHTLPPALMWTTQELHSLENVRADVSSARRRFLLYLRFNWMGLSIRKPTLQQYDPDLDQNITCIGIAELIIAGFLQWHEELDILKFPHLRYLLGATIASLSILTSEPSLHESHVSLVVSAAELLKRSCYQSWVSGKTTRTIARVYSAVQSMRQFERPSNPSDFEAPQDSSRIAVARSMKSLETNAKGDENRLEASRAATLMSPDSSDFMQTAQTLLTSESGMLGSVSDFVWPDLNMDGFDFEATLHGMDNGEEATDTWLDSLSFAPAFPNYQPS